MRIKREKEENTSNQNMKDNEFVDDYYARTLTIANKNLFKNGAIKY